MSLIGFTAMILKFGVICGVLLIALHIAEAVILFIDLLRGP